MVLLLMSANPFLPLFTIVIAALLLSGCASVQFGHDFDIDVFETKVERTVSSKADVKKWLGAPSSRGFSVTNKGERNEKWGYFYGNGKLPNLGNATLKILEVEFNQQGVVQSYNWSE